MRVIIFFTLCFCSFTLFSDDTILKYYRPFGETKEQISPFIKSRLKGECSGQSHLIIREDAWRCQAEGKTFDPCFVNSANNKKIAVCPQSPWVGDSVAIAVSIPLNNDHHLSLDMSRTFPWAVELMNGEYCQAIDSTESYDSMPVRYRCSHHNVLIGYLQRCKTKWSILEKTPEGVFTVELKKAWF
jgi:hypothetical protein